MRRTIKPERTSLKLKDLLTESKKRVLTNDELLYLCSNIFYHPISVLETCKSYGEYNKRPAVTTAFNLLRTIDNIEDGDLKEGDKPWLIRTFVNDIVGKIVRKDPSQDISTVLSGDEMVEFCDSLVEGSRNDAELAFAENLKRGAVLKELHSFDIEVKEAIEYSCLGIYSGMTEFLERGEIQDFEQLDSYCFHVAGRVGSFLTQLVRLKDRDLQSHAISLDSLGAENFGAFLQLINIAQNVRKDWDEGKRAYFPAMLRPAKMSHQYLVVGAGADARDARTQALDGVLSRAEDRFRESAGYILSIPDSLRGYKSFNLMLLISGRTMLQSLRNAGAEEVFGGDEKATIPSQGVLENIYNFSKLITKRETRADYWLEDYARFPPDFSFENGEFRNWASRYLS